MSASIRIDNVIKDFPAGDEMVRVLHGISLTIPFGQLSMLVGPSGCGKTTLLSIITGILTPTSGEVTIDGTNITRLKDHAKVLYRRESLGFIFQQYNLLPALTAAENACVPLVAAGMALPEAVRAAKKVLERMGMGPHANKLPSQLSGGQQQRVSIARALVHEPKMIVCDEPTAALDAQTGQSVMEALREVALKPARAVLVVTHDNRIYHFADRIIHMSDGHIDQEEIITQGAAT